MPDVTFTSWGSASSIGPSCQVLSFGTFRVGVDYGAGYREGESEPAYDGPLDAIIVTHAHRDHVGMLPLALSRWPRTQSWATFETMSLARWIWEDELNLRRMSGLPYPFSPEDAERASRRTRRLMPGNRVELTDNVTVTPFTAGHILGAVGLIFEYHGERYAVTGDISLNDHPFVSGASVPVLDRTRALIRESTYVGEFPTVTRAETILRFIRTITDTLEAGGRVVIPTLSIDRMAEIFSILHDSGIAEEWPLWVIGGVKPSEIYLDYASGAHILGAMRRFENRQHQEDTRKSGFPMVVLASSGMVAPGSPSYTWASEILGDPESALLFVNWQDPLMPGGLILNGAHDSEIELPTGTYRRQCHVERFDFSTHAKEDEMAEIEERLNPDKVIHVHGESSRINEFIASERSRVRSAAVVGAEFAL